jgi:hypothetical protein
MPQSRADYIKALKAEYIVAEEAARLLDEIISVLPEGRREALYNLSPIKEKELPDKEFRKEARAAVIRELLEYLETELNSPPRPRPHIITAKESINDEILIKLLQLHFDHNKTVTTVEQHGLELGIFYINILSIVFDALGVPKWKEDEETSDSNYRKAPEPFDDQ